MTTLSIYRYTLDVSDPVVRLPLGATILRFAARGQAAEQIEFWALVNLDNPTEEVTFRVYGTGHTIPTLTDVHYLDSVITAHGSLVWHVFRVLPS